MTKRFIVSGFGYDLHTSEEFETLEEAIEEYDQTEVEGYPNIEYVCLSVLLKEKNRKKGEKTD